jgi:hypothetical protein
MMPFKSFSDQEARMRRHHEGEQMAELSRKMATLPPNMDSYERSRQIGNWEAEMSAHRDDYKLKPDRGY